jgi:hypothetical protein
MYPVCFDELIGKNTTLAEWRRVIKEIKSGEILFLNGYSGVGKTVGTHFLLEEFAFKPLFLDTNNSIDGKDILDRINKFHKWANLTSTMTKGEEGGTGRKIIVIDEIESLMKVDRNVLNYVLSYHKEHKAKSHPIILIGHCDIVKKLGDMKNYVTTYMHLERLDPTDIFTYFKERTARKKLRLADLKNIVKESNGNIYAAMLSIANRVKEPIKVQMPAYVGNEQKTLTEVFECKNPLIIEKLLNDDDWMNPLKIHENIIKVINGDVYAGFLNKYLYYEVWISKVYENIGASTNLPITFLTMAIVSALNAQKDATGKIDAMDFSKLLSYISTKKKYKKLLYEKVGPGYPIEDLGLYWVHSHIYTKGS